MAWTTRTATDFRDCLDIVRQFTQKAFAAGAVTQNVGSFGQVYGASATHNSVAETWTLVCTTLGGNGTAVFSVTGGVSGAQANATSGVPYSIDEVSFILTAGTTDFAVNDEFEFDIAVSTPDWVEDFWTTDRDGNGNYELIQHGTGAGSDEIFCAWYTLSNESTYWNWGVSGLTGYVDRGSFSLGAQPGWNPYYDCMNNASFEFTCIFTSRHVKVIPTSVTGVTGGSYLGWLIPHATPSQWTYPMFGGGSTDDSTELVGSTDSDHTCYWAANGGNLSGAVLDITLWREINKFSPRHYADFENWRPGYVDAEMRLYPAVPIDEASDNVYGELEGVYYPTQHIPGGGNLSEGDVIISSDITALVFRDVFRTDFGDYIAMDLMGDL